MTEKNLEQEAQELENEFKKTLDWDSNEKLNKRFSLFCAQKIQEAEIDRVFSLKRLSDLDKEQCNKEKEQIRTETLKEFSQKIKDDPSFYRLIGSETLKRHEEEFEQVRVEALKEGEEIGFNRKWEVKALYKKARVETAKEFITEFSKCFNRITHEWEMENEDEPMPFDELEEQLVEALKARFLPPFWVQAEKNKEVTK